MKCARILVATSALMGAPSAARAFPSTNPEITLTPSSTCYGTGATVTVNVVLSNGPAPIVGGQFFLSYDKNRLTFLSADPAPSVWTVQLFEGVNASAGTIDYAVGIPNGSSGTVSGTMAILTFTAVTEVCNSSGLISFRVHTPPTRVIDENNISYVAGTSLDVYGLPAISNDDTAPVSTTAPGAGDANLACDDSAGLAASLAFVPGFVDACAASPIVELVSDVTTPGEGGGYVRVRVWTAGDACDNHSDPYVQTITVTGSCDDGDACTVNDRCVDGECHGTPISCDDGNPCTADACVNGTCNHDPLPSGSGDANADGWVDGRDIQGFQTALFGGPATPGYCAVDMNGDGAVTMADVPGFVAALLGG